VPTTWAKGFDSTLIPPDSSFEDNMANLGLTEAAAEILDDVHFLVISTTDPPSEKNTTLKIRSTASWIVNKLGAVRPVTDGTASGGDEVIQDSIGLPSLVHCRSVAGTHIQAHTALGLAPGRAVHHHAQSQSADMEENARHIRLDRVSPLPDCHDRPTDGADSSGRKWLWPVYP
jgi:hypothetical protein